jgi:hypothetical protein
MIFESKNLRKILLSGFALVLISSSLIQVAQAQPSYRKGQHIEPAYEGWKRNEDGTVTLIFGYFNENWEEEPNVPVGDNNFFSPGNPDRGQPTHFLPRRNRFTWEVDMPRGWDEDEELTWTVTSGAGITRTAYASMNIDYVVDTMVIASENGSLGAGTSSPESRSNVPPIATVLGDAQRTAQVGEPIIVRTLVVDDGIPKPRATRTRTIEAEEADIEAAGGTLTPAQVYRARLLRRPSRSTVGKTNGLFLSWSVYRGDGATSFEPPQVKPWEDTRTSANSPWGALWTPSPIPEDGIWETNITFDEPGEYILWGRADDGGLYHDVYVTVNVTR